MGKVTKHLLSLHQATEKNAFFYFVLCIVFCHCIYLLFVLALGFYKCEPLLYSIILIIITTLHEVAFLHRQKVYLQFVNLHYENSFPIGMITQRDNVCIVIYNTIITTESTESTSLQIIFVKVTFLSECAWETLQNWMEIQVHLLIRLFITIFFYINSKLLPEELYSISK
jgi:hypothetical protein